MATLILAGVPRGVFLRNKSFQVAVPGWKVVWVKSKSDRVDVTNSWADVVAAADETEDGAHILAFHSNQDSRAQFEDDIYARHRLIWLDKALLREYGSQSFNEALIHIAGFERDWREHIRPAHHGDPMILPESAFRPFGGFDDTWIRVQRVRDGWDDLTKLRTRLDRFTARHRILDGWFDSRDLIFDGRGTRHGIAQKFWRWKYTFLVDQQFHFDVRHKHNSRFEVYDKKGKVHRINGYTNIDCHGHIRG